MKYIKKKIPITLILTLAIIMTLSLGTLGAPMISIETAPLAAVEITSAWALVNLICAILTCLVALGMVVTLLKKDRKGENEEAQKPSRPLGKLLGIFPAITAIEVFILTENMNDPMHLTDRWTILMIMILALALVMSFITRNREENKQQAAAN